MSAEFPPRLQPIDAGYAANIELDLSSGAAPDPVWHDYVWRRVVRVGDFTGAAALAQSLDLFADISVAARSRPGQSGEFKGDVWINISPGPYGELLVPFSGGAVATCTIEFGTIGDPDAQLTASNVFTGAPTGILQTPAAAEFEAMPERSHTPVMTIRTTTGNVADLTAGAFEVVIGYRSYLRGVA